MAIQKIIFPPHLDWHRSSSRALGAQLLDLLGDLGNCNGLIKSIMCCKLSDEDFRRAGLRRVTNSLFGGRGDT